MRSVPTADERFKCELVSRDGVRLHVRPIRADDVDRERCFIAALSEESRYQRLFYVLREPSLQLLSQLTTIDFDRTMALVVVDPSSSSGDFVAVARYARDTTGKSAEFAVTVANQWQGRGVGTQLTTTLFEFAARRGIEHIYGTIFATNERMLQVARNLGMTVTSVPGDASLMIVSLDLEAVRPTSPRCQPARRTQRGFMGQ